ncbi:MAG: DUF2953 domain-containing protein [Lachnospiraceae bacterium]|nr:DUF2953 domain-containing protein [Lachnospiraceae bacterium]
MIFLSILKIIGIVLACIVGFALLLVLLVLFAPIQYKIHSEGENADTIITGSVQWIFGLASVKFAYLNFTFGYKVKAAGIKILMGKFPDEKIEESELPEQLSQKPVDERMEKGTEEKKEELPEIEFINVEDDKKDSTENGKKEKEEELPFQKKLNSLKLKYEKAKAILESDVTKKAIKFIKIQIFNILNHIKPKNITGKLNFGLEDPANTAIIYGLIGSITEIISNNKLVVTPEFYQKGVNSDLSISGSIFIGYVVLCFLRLLLDKNVKRLFRAVRRIV